MTGERMISAEEPAERGDQAVGRSTTAPGSWDGVRGRSSRPIGRPTGEEVEGPAAVVEADAEQACDCDGRADLARDAVVIAAVDGCGDGAGPPSADRASTSPA